jgi:hypothetical protein
MLRCVVKAPTIQTRHEIPVKPATASPNLGWALHGGGVASRQRHADGHQARGAPDGRGNSAALKEGQCVGL